MDCWSAEASVLEAASKDPLLKQVTGLLVYVIPTLSIQKLFHPRDFNSTSVLSVVYAKCPKIEIVNQNYKSSYWCWHLRALSVCCHRHYEAAGTFTLLSHPGTYYLFYLPVIAGVTCSIPSSNFTIAHRPQLFVLPLASPSQLVLPPPHASLLPLLSYLNPFSS